ncbi:MAG: MTH1187 family thiamine-binding protein [Desulfosoma sp.]|uniref:MTH1187 family thiamine-binding protein n=1 Tax=Desulfosoma sp. TaxID=2603217 RepID=UPI00404A1A00
MAIVEVSVVPLGTARTSLSNEVARAVAVLQASGLSYELTAMGTIIYGDLDKILETVRAMHESCFQSGVQRVLTQIKIDDRRDQASTPQEKVRSVLEKMKGAVP